jgi:hypothetical protein
MSSSQSRAKTQRHLTQQFVADLAAEGVVDPLEPVEVDEQHAAGRFVALRHHQRLVEQLRQQAAVGQIGQGVVTGQVVQSLFGLFAPGNVAQVGDQAGRPIVGVAQPRERRAGPEHVAGFLAAPHFHHAPALRGEAVVNAGLLLVDVQEQDVVADRFDRAVAEQPLGALVPAVDVAGQVEREDRFFDLVEHLQLVGQLRLDLHVGMGRALGQRMHLQQAAVSLARLARWRRSAWSRPARPNTL